VPGEITSALSHGTNALLRLGAIPVTCADDVLEVLGLDPTPPPAPVMLEPRLARVHEAVIDAPSAVDELVQRTGLGAGHVSAALAELELRGLVVQAAGLYRGVMA
jgi:DNA processing protein